MPLIDDKLKFFSFEQLLPFLKTIKTLVDAKLRKADLTYGMEIDEDQIREN